jgi:hypothetical protein
MNSYFKGINIFSPMVGDTIEYYAPESVVDDHFNICKGTRSTILPNDSLQEMKDVHFYIDMV